MPKVMLSALNKVRNFLYRTFGYRTLGARALIIKDNQVLLIKHTYQPGWYTIGGGVERGETFKEAILREMKEEVGIINVKNIKLFNIYYNNFKKHDDYVAFYIVQDFESESSSSMEISEQKWFHVDNLPIDITPATLTRINEYLGKAELSEYWKVKPF